MRVRLGGWRCVEQKLSIPVLSLQDSKYSIWNTYYLEWLLFGILSYSTSFTQFHWFHSLPIYYRLPCVLRTINHFSFHHPTFNKMAGEMGYNVEGRRESCVANNTRNAIDVTKICN